ncbi:MAG: Gfo/Idh/MocA family oxidoreductase [Bryobacterales bacterium]|nr:Gfo/Idh/MocA family oxidoreductase [Bryobacterales bacterium]
MSDQGSASRRRVLQAAAIALPLAAVRGTAANSAPTVALIGCGGRGGSLAGALLEATDARLVAMCDLFDEQIARTKERIGIQSPKEYQDLNELLASDVDAVIIATPPFVHADHFEAAVKAGKHIYIEKPAAVTVEDCKRIMRAADSADREVNITMGYQRRYAKTYTRAKQVHASGAIGDIRMAHAHFLKTGPSPRSSAERVRPQTRIDKIKRWHIWKDLAGDLIVENNVHCIDVLNWFIGGHPLSAVGRGARTAGRAGDMRDNNNVVYEYEGGVLASLAGSTLGSNSYREVHEQFFGTNGMIETSELHWRHYRRRGDDVLQKAERSTTLDSMEAFVRRVAEGRPENTGVRGVESTLTAILGQQAMDARGEVTWDEMMAG